jgi:hypothetical protein
VKAVSGIYYVSECGRCSADPRLAAVLDVEHWLSTQKLPIGEQAAAQDICARLDEYPDLVERIMRQYQAALAAADLQAQALRPQLPTIVT